MLALPLVWASLVYVRERNIGGKGEGREVESSERETV